MWKDSPELGISAIHFAYDNKKVIDLLKERGDILTNGKYEKLKKIEEEM